jgi:DNA-binding protein H-NS
MASYKDLQAQIAKLQAQAEDARSTEVAAVIAEIKQKIDDFGLKPEDLGFATPVRRGRPAKKAPLPPKYQNARTGETWSGRGKPPKWIAGKNRERFLIEP